MKAVKTSIQLEISEPWDFEVPGKGNRLDGVIEGSCAGPDEKTWRGKHLLVGLRSPVTWKSQQIKQVLLSPRYEGESLDLLQQGKSLTVGIARVKPDVSISPSQSFSKDEVAYFAIGSAKIQS
jgi:hypothetical protein